MQDQQKVFEIGATNLRSEGNKHCVVHLKEQCITFAHRIWRLVPNIFDVFTQILVKFLKKRRNVWLFLRLKMALISFALLFKVLKSYFSSSLSKYLNNFTMLKLGYAGAKVTCLPSPPSAPFVLMHVIAPYVFQLTL